ncbi:MAG: hypothetical protein L0213_11665, partial [Candidatus Dadabacteria bacterium]|nr:hypothetical protein [Candidatus Dadabacteria bacterium]
MSNDEKMQILQMLEDGKITAAEAEKLMAALDDIDLIAADNESADEGAFSVNLGEITEELGNLREELRGLKELKKLRGLGAIIAQMGFSDTPAATEIINWEAEDNLAKLAINITNGKIDLKAGDKTALVITKKYFGNSDGAEEKLVKIAIEVAQNGDDARLEVAPQLGPFGGRFTVDIEGT